MYQWLIRIVQIAIVGFAVYVFATEPSAPDIPLGTVVIGGAIIAFIVTVIPWLAFHGVRDLYIHFRYPESRTPRDPDRIKVRDVIAWLRAGAPRAPRTKGRLEV